MNGTGNSTARMVRPRRNAKIWMTGFLTMRVIKTADPGGGLCNGSILSAIISKKYAYWTPPGSRTVPPTKSQKNLRYKTAQNEDQTASVTHVSTLEGGNGASERTNGASNGDKASPIVPDEFSHCLSSCVEKSKRCNGVGWDENEMNVKSAAQGLEETKGPASSRKGQGKESKREQQRAQLNPKEEGEMTVKDKDKKLSLKGRPNTGLSDDSD